jgi:hypothetical protein
MAKLTPAAKAVSVMAVDGTAEAVPLRGVQWGAFGGWRDLRREGRKIFHVANLRDVEDVRRPRAARVYGICASGGGGFGYFSANRSRALP